MIKKFICGTDDNEIINNYIEISIDPSLLNSFANEDGMSSFLSTCSSSEKVKELKSDLLGEVMHIIENCLTAKQKEVMKMTYLDGKTQNEISLELGKHQTAIHKMLKGNIDYSNNKKRYGGALKKIRKLCSNSERIQEILMQIKDENNFAK